MTGSEAVERYIRQRVGLGQFSPATARQARYALHAWLRHVRDWTDPTPDEVVGWVIGVRSADAKHRRECVLRCFYHHARKHGWVAQVPDVPTVPGSRKRPRPIPDETLARVLRRASARDADAIVLGRFAGLRASEIAACHRDHLAEGDLYVLGKGGRERWIPAHPHVVAVVGGVSGWVFPSPVRPGEPVLGQTMSDWLSEALSPWTAHSLRHAFATDMYDRTRDLVLVAELLGHESTRTTERYVRVRSDRAAEVIARMGLAA